MFELNISSRSTYIHIIRHLLANRCEMEFESTMVPHSNIDRYLYMLTKVILNMLDCLFGVRFEFVEKLL